MIEIVCPSCAARYQVPDDSIGPEGRRVTCSNCSHKWRAYPQGAAEAPSRAPEPAPDPATGSPAGADAAPEPAPESAAPAAAAEAGETAEPAGQPASGSREAQMDAIRRMLDDLKRSAEDEPGPEPEPARQRAGRPEPTNRRRDEDQVVDEPEAGGDPLRSRIDKIGKEGRPGKEAGPSNYDAARLRKMHEKRAKRMQKARERKRKSGAFLTGFTLVAVVAAMMVGLYVLQPQIVASSPQMAPAMNEYVVTVDRYRLALDEATADWRAWVVERVGPLLGGEDAQAQGAGQATEPAASE